MATGEPLFHVYGNAVSLGDHQLRGAVAFGPERTMEQDSTLAFRIIVDIAIKALSKAINDPTTAVLALDQLQRLLGVVGQRHLHREEILGESGELRVVSHTKLERAELDLLDRTIEKLHALAEDIALARTPDTQGLGGSSTP